VLKSSDPESLNNMCSKCQWPSCTFLNMEVFMNDREFSGIKIFSTFRKGNTAVYDQSWKLPASQLQQWAAYPLFSKLSEITSVLQMSVTNQQRSIKNFFFTETEDQGSLYLVLKSSNTEYSFFAISHCRV